LLQPQNYGVWQKKRQWQVTTFEVVALKKTLQIPKRENDEKSCNNVPLKHIGRANLSKKY
jgi:hypothetical protein